MTGSRGMLAAKEPLVVPMLVRLSHFKLNSYVVLVVSKQKGITLVFKTDPLQNVDINSTFDSIAVIQKFIQGEIEGQLRQMFREDLPSIVHRLSQRWVKAKVEAPYLHKRPPLPKPRPFDTASAPDLTYLLPTAAIGLHERFRHPLSLYHRSRSIPGSSNTTLPRNTTHGAKASPSEPSDSSSTATSTSFPDLEHFDPTYGLRPMGILSNNIFPGFGRLFKLDKGLADLVEKPSDEEQIQPESLRATDWEGPPLDDSPPPSLFEDTESVTEYETVPAVGGGIVTRPRVYHSRSIVHPAAEVSDDLFSSSPASPYVRDPYVRDDQRTARSHWKYPSTFLPHACIRSRVPPTYHSSSNYGTGSEDAPYGYEPDSTSYFELPDARNRYASQSGSEKSHSIETPELIPSHALPIKSSLPPRRLSVSSSSGFEVLLPGSPPAHRGLSEADPRIVLRPALNDTVHQLSTLSHSNHTLSPYTRSPGHFTVRSVPPRTGNTSGVQAIPDRRPAKAKRKRMYRIGGLRPEPLPSSLSPVPPSEFEQADMDQYFRFCDDSAIHQQRR